MLKNFTCIIKKVFLHKLEKILWFSQFLLCGVKSGEKNSNETAVFGFWLVAESKRLPNGWLQDTGFCIFFARRLLQKFEISHWTK